MMKKKTAILLVNLGSPDSPKPRDVYRYLTEFLNDPRVIDLPWLARKLLVNCIIVPFRHRKSARVYEQLWTPEGSPLIATGRKLGARVQERFDEGHQRVFLAMRYQNPSMNRILEEVRLWGPDQIILIPLFPHYASASGGSVLEKALRIISGWWVIPELKFISQFYDHPLYIRAFAENGRKFDLSSFDHVLFSYHGLPERQVDKVYKDNACRNHSCETEMNEENRFCYKATCYATTRMIAAELGIAESDYTVCFQSRLGKGWIEPFSDVVITDLAKKGAKRLLVFSPAFVADCLETTVEIGHEYQELFMKSGGELVQLVPSLNEGTTWIDCLEDMVRTRL